MSKYAVYDASAPFSGSLQRVIVRTCQTQSEANAVAARDAALMAYNGALDDLADTGLFVTISGAGAGGISSVLLATDASIKASIKADVKADAIVAWNSMRPIWNENADGSLKDSMARKRFKNTWYWILGAAQAVIVAANNTAWTVAHCKTALDAYRALIGRAADPRGTADWVEFWYLNHNTDAYNDYYIAAAGQVNVYFKYERGQAVPARGADANSNTRWNGAAGSATPNATVDDNSTPHDLSIN